MVGILVDVTKCTGCERCADACVRSHQLPTEAADRDRALTADGLTAHRWSTVTALGQGRFARKACMHCLEPSCVDACLVGGLSKTAEGAVVYDSARCIGCRYCMLACPYHIPRYEWEEPVPYMRKCDLCIERLRQGGQPACVEACPNQALAFGLREDLLKQAHALIAAHPHRYLPRVWGEHEYGGSSVLYVSDVDLGALGWPEPSEPAVSTRTRPLIEKTPVMGLGVACGLWALGAIIERRNHLMGRDATERGTRPAQTHPGPDAEEEDESV